MRRHALLPLLTTVTTLLLAFVPERAVAAGEFSLLGAYEKATFGGDSEFEAQGTLLRFSTGNIWQIWTEVPLLRVRSTLEVTPTGLGPTAMGSQNRLSGQSSVGQSTTGQGGSAGSQETGQGGIEGDAGASLQDSWSSGLGDIRVSVNRRFLGGGVKLFRLDASVGVKAPTGDEAQALGTGEWDYRVGVAGEYRFWSAKGFGGIGWNWLGDPAWVEFNDVAELYLGVESNPVAGRYIFSGWVDGNQEIIEGVGSQAALGFGFRTTGKFRWRTTVTAGLTDATADFTVQFGLSIGVATPSAGRRGELR